MVGIPEKLISNGTYVRRSFGVCLIYFRLFYHFIVFLCFSLCQMGSNWEWWAFRQYVVRSKIHHYVTKKTFQLMKCKQGIWQVASQETNKLSNQYRELMRRSSLISTFFFRKAGTQWEPSVNRVTSTCVISVLMANPQKYLNYFGTSAKQSPPTDSGSGEAVVIGFIKSVLGSVPLKITTHPIRES